VLEELLAAEQLVIGAGGHSAVHSLGLFYRPGAEFLPIYGVPDGSVIAGPSNWGAGQAFGLPGRSPWSGAGLSGPDDEGDVDEGDDHHRAGDDQHIADVVHEAPPRRHAETAVMGSCASPNKTRANAAPRDPAATRRSGPSSSFSHLIISEPPTVPTPIAARRMP
jgi:hypothetical protein